MFIPDTCIGNIDRLGTFRNVLQVMGNLCHFRQHFNKDHTGNRIALSGVKTGNMICFDLICQFVNLGFRINRRLAELMNVCDNYDVRIEEIHHTQKKDAPSGTAITLAEGIISNIERKSSWHCIEPQQGEESRPQADSIEITSLREGMVPGTHTVTYESEDDVLEVRHTLKSRRALATGAVIAAEFICGKSGVFTMDDILN